MNLNQHPRRYKIQDSTLKKSVEDKILIDDQKVIHFRDNGTVRVSTENKLPSLTDTQFAEDSDINNIVAKYAQLGQQIPPPQTVAKYTDLTQIPDLATAMNIVTESQNLFDALPAEARYRFHNNPEEMLEFLKDPENDKEAIKLGLKNKPKPQPIPQTPTHAQNDDLNDDKTKSVKKPKSQNTQNNDQD